MNILFVSTISHNPGDEFIRFGAMHIMRQLYPDAQLISVHKHDPRTLFAGFQQRPETPHRLLSPYLYSFYAATAGRNKENYLESADLVVFAGTPFIWRTQVNYFRSTSENAEWVGPTWKRLFNELKNKPVLNLAAGTSVTNQTQFNSILTDQKVSSFLKQAVQRSALTSARDEKTQQILAALGYQVPLIPCSSILASKGAYLSPQKPEYVAVNLMRSAAHSWRGQRGNEEHWKATALEAVSKIEKHHKILFVSHSKAEDEVAKEWFPQHPRFFSKDPVALLRAYSKAYYGLCNRVHAGAAIATFGRPVVVVGGDSRINLVSQFGLPAFDHRDIDGTFLVNEIQKMEEQYDEYVQRLRAKTDYAESEYLEMTSRALGIE